MSRTGNIPIKLPEKVKVSLVGNQLMAEGPLGKEMVPVHTLTKLEIKDKEVVVRRNDDTKSARAAHGLVRSLIVNAVQGVSKGFLKQLEINGVGYRAQVSGQKLKLALGYSHDINYDIPAGIKVVAPDQTKLTISGSSKEMVGRVASQIRKFRPPEPYKGKGIKYAGEVIIRKVGKAAGGK